MIKLLLLDDDYKFHTYISDMLSTLSQLTFTLSLFDNYEEALDQLNQHTFDLCLVDYNLGDRQDRTGIDFIREAIAQKPFLPFILLTANRDESLVRDGIDVGAIDFIQKTSLNPALLNKAIHYSIKQSQNLQELDALYQQVKLANQIKSDMIRLAAHDIKNPLSTIHLAVDLINLTSDPASHEKYIERIKASSQRIQEIINDVLNLERLEDMSNLQPINLNHIVHSVYFEYATQAREKQQTVLFAGDETLIVNGVAGQLREVVHNLISNAFKYTPQKGHVEIRVECADDMAIVRIKDTGCGIPQHAHEQLFQPFTRIHTPETADIDGTGLGLYLVKRIVERHQGEVIFESEYGVGSTFGFCLPLVQDGAQSQS